MYNYLGMGNMTGYLIKILSKILHIKSTCMHTLCPITYYLHEVQQSRHSNIFNLILYYCFRNNNEVEFVSVTHKLKLLIAKCDFIKCALEQIKLLDSQIGEIQKSMGIRDKIVNIKKMTWCR